MNEYKWAENAIKEKKFIDKPYESLIRIARYYTYNGFNKREVRDYLEKFILSCDNSISMASWDDKLDSIIKYADKRKLHIIDKIDISETEISEIKNLEGRQLQRLAFTLLCVAKYSNMVYEKNECWVNVPDKEIMKMANISTSIKRQSLLYSKLRDLGLIRFSNKIDNLSVQILFADNNKSVIEIKDFRNIGYQYMNYIDGGYFICASCGITCKENKQSSKKQKYCPDCAVKIHLQQRVCSVMRGRNKIESVDISK